MTPSVQEALASAQSIKSSQKKRWLRIIVTLVIGISISLFFPPAAVCVIISLIVVQKIKCGECESHEHILRQFAWTRNWYGQYGPQTELRHVDWQKRQVRFYSTPSLLSVNAIADRVISNDFAPRMPPPTGEVPRKQPASKQSPFTGSPPSENVPKISSPITLPPHIPPAGWNPTPIIPFLHEELSIPAETPPTDLNPAPVISPTSPKEQRQPTVQTNKLPRQSTRTFPETTAQEIPNPSPAPEGGRKPKTNYAVVRSAKLRRAAIQIYGRNCSACGFNFDETFGEILSQGYIEIHHLNSIAAGVRNTDPTTDLAPLCGNCHAMADRLTRHHASPPRSIGELRKLLFPASSLPDLEMHSAAKAPKSPLKIKIGKIREKKPKKGS